MYGGIPPYKETRAYVSKIMAGGGGGGGAPAGSGQASPAAAAAPAPAAGKGWGDLDIDAPAASSGSAGGLLAGLDTESAVGAAAILGGGGFTGFAGDGLAAALQGLSGGGGENRDLGVQLVDLIGTSDTGAGKGQSAVAPEAVAATGKGLGIVDLGKRLQQLGFKVAENPAFGGVGRHSPNSHHYAGNALDLTIQPGSPLLKGRKDSDWKALTAQYGAQLKAALPGAEIFHPGDDPVGGHHSHIHVALPKGSTGLTPQLARLLQLG